MKKKIFSLVLAFCVIIPTLMLSACGKNPEEPNSGSTPENGSTPSASSKFLTDGMTKEQIISKLRTVTSCTYDEYVDDEHLYTTYVGTDYYCYKGFDGEDITRYEMQFIEDNRFYEINYNTGTDKSDDDNIDIVDFTGFETEFSSVDGIKYEIDYIIKYQLNDEYADKYSYKVENGNLKITETELDGKTWVYVYRNFNKTKMFAVPEKYKNYKTMSANEDAIEYSLISEHETVNGKDIYGTYQIKSISKYIKTCEIPEKYNGVGVTYYYSSPSRYSALRTITLPTSIVKLGNDLYRYEENEELHIIYKGTKAQWKAIENSEMWSKTASVRVTCSDGDYTPE